jgi:signal peptidase I
MDEVQPVRNRKRRWRLLLLLIPALVGVLWYGSRAVGYVAFHRAYMVPAASMAPAVLPGDRIIVDTQPRTPTRGEIWAISGPNNMTIIKRVIGLPGETIELAGGRVLIDGKPLAEPYLPASSAPMTSVMAPVQLGTDQYFLMGDNRNLSLDSRVFGPVQKGRFVGRADHRYWPSNRIGPLR